MIIESMAQVGGSMGRERGAWQERTARARSMTGARGRSVRHGRSAQQDGRCSWCSRVLRSPWQSQANCIRAGRAVEKLYWPPAPFPPGPCRHRRAPSRRTAWATTPPCPCWPPRPTCSTTTSSSGLRRWAEENFLGSPAARGWDRAAPGAGCSCAPRCSWASAPGGRAAEGSWKRPPLRPQVTNPPIDPLREGLVMSLEMRLGRRGNLLEPGPGGWAGGWVKACQQRRSAGGALPRRLQGAEGGAPALLGERAVQQAGGDSARAALLTLPCYAGRPARPTACHPPTHPPISPPPGR